MEMGGKFHGRKFEKVNVAGPAGCVSMIRCDFVLCRFRVVHILILRSLFVDTRMSKVRCRSYDMVRTSCTYMLKKKGCKYVFSCELTVWVVHPQPYNLCGTSVARVLHSI